MPEIKRAFNAGRMNKDLDERLVPQGEYIEANNVQIVAPEEGAIGVIKNIKGNSLIEGVGLIDAKAVGSAVDTATNKIYWFIYSQNVKAIAVYDGATVSPVLVDTNNVLNFTGDKIYSINILESKYIAWTDNNSEPKIIDIDLFASGCNGFETHTLLNNVPFIEEDITVIKKSPLNAPTILIEDTVDPDKDVLFELEFVRFAYRWEFNNRQYSVMSPFSETVFLPGEFNYSAKEAYNLAMVNTMKRVTLSNIERNVNGIAYIEILAKKSNSDNIYVVDRIAPSYLDDPVNNGNYIIDKNQLNIIIPSGQLIRQWDAVPTKAKAQEFISNRLVYGNYTIGMDTTGINPLFNVSVSTREINPGKKSIKTNASYKLGVVFQDKYGRKTPVISNSSGSVSLPFNDRQYLISPNAFKVKMDDTYTDQLNFFTAKDITHFKYFIKNNNGQYYNACAYEIFPDLRERDAATDEAIGNPWIAFPSTEINKFKEGDFLLLKKRQNESTPLANPAAKFKVLELSASAPIFIGKDPVDYGYPTTGPTNTNFAYETHDTSGKFYVKVEDIDNILSSAYITSTLAAENRVIAEPDFAYNFNQLGTYLGKSVLAIPAGPVYEVEITEYYYNNGIVNFFVSFSGQTSTYTESAIFPEGDQLTTIFNCGTTEFNPAGEIWYELASNVITDGVPETVRTKWGTPQTGLLEVNFCSAEAVEGKVYNPAIFETEPDDNILDIYYETEETYPISEYNNLKELRWFNCFSFSNGVESNRIRDDFNELVIDNQARVSITIQNEYEEQVNKSGIIWSGIYNARNITNNLNQFSTGEPITKDLSPEYGSIQRLFARNTDLISFCEDKVIKILANKDALYNADGSTNITASNAVLGQAIAFAGEFGISKNPESLADYGYRTYFTDKERGVVLRLSMDGLEVISDDGMSSWFRNKFRSHTGAINGAYDIYSNQYIVSFEGQNEKSVSYSEYTKGWTSFHGYTFEEGLSLNGDFYTLKSGELWKHYNTDVYSNIYGTQLTADVKFVFNEEASVIKNFKTLSYEGSQGWEVDSITTDIQTGQIINFVGKEGKYFDYISGNSAFDVSNFSVQGLGIVETNVITD